MSTSPNFSQKQFLQASVFNTAMASILSASHDTNARFHSVGLVNPADATYSIASLVVTADLPSPFAIEFGSGALSYAHGTVTNADTQTYAVNFAPFVPASGSSTVYMLASAVTIQQVPYTVIGPPIGHPSYSPTFVPYVAYTTNVESIAVTASTTPPDNVTTFELGRTTLVAGQTTITTFSTANIVLASSLLAPTGVTAGAYSTPTITVGADGRIQAIATTGPYVKQGGGPRQLANALNLGWTADGLVGIAVDGSDQGDIANTAYVLAQVATEATARNNEDVAIINDFNAQVANEAATRAANDVFYYNTLLGSIEAFEAEFQFTGGWAKFGGGMVMQWGLGTIGQGSQGNGFPIAFPNDCILVFATVTYAYGGPASTPSLTTIASADWNQFNFQIGNAVSSAGFAWLAIGF